MKITMPALSAYRWIKILLPTFLTVVGSVAGFNYAVDPYGTRSWFVDQVYKPIVHERSEKYNYIFYQNNIDKYDCLILGSSRVMSLLPSALKNEHCYNFGVHVANNPEKLFILEEWLKRAPLKNVYLGNELYNLHSQSQPLRLNPSQFTHGSEGNYLSFQTFLISIKSLQNQLTDQRQTYFESDGSIRYPIDEEAIRIKKFDHSPAHFRHFSEQIIHNDYKLNPFDYEKNALEPLKKIQSLCSQNHVNLYVFVTPTFSEIQFLMAHDPKLSLSLNQFKNDLTTIFGTVYDFDTNHSLNQNPKNFYDPLHYRPALGDHILERFHSDNGYGNLLHH